MDIDTKKDDKVDEAEFKAFFARCDKAAPKEDEKNGDADHHQHHWGLDRVRTPYIETLLYRGAPVWEYSYIGELQYVSALI